MEKSCQILVDTRAILSTLNPTFINQQIPQSEEKFSIVEVSNKVQRLFQSQPIQRTPGPFPEKHSFLLCDAAPVNLLGRDLLCNLKRLIHFASNGDLTLEFAE